MCAHGDGTTQGESRTRRFALISGLVVLFATTLTPLPVFADAGAVFCKGSMSFTERVEPSGALGFRFIGANGQGSVMEVNGTASPHKGGWRYQVKSERTPEDRCTLDITPEAGGFRLQTIEGARCESSGGHDAELMLRDARFPAVSKVKGVAAEADHDGFRDFDCLKRRYGAATAAPSQQVVLVAAIPSPPAPSSTPSNVVAAVLRLDDGSWGKLFADKPTALMRLYFTRGFNRSWAVAMSHHRDGPFIDGDPVTGWQGVSAIAARAIQARADGADTAVVTAAAPVTTDGGKQPETLTFTLKREDGAWKIDDIGNRNQPSIRAYLRKP